MILKRKIYDKLLEWKKDATVEGYFTQYLNDLDTFFMMLSFIHPRNFMIKDDIICIPPYMTICL